MPADLLFELGCEEIPAKMLAKALADLPAAVTQALAKARLDHGAVRALGTPRRVAVIVRGLADRQPDLDETVVGPPIGAAFAPDGTLTKAGQGFAAKNGVDAAALEKKEVPGKKGLYVVATRHVSGHATRALLPELLRELVAAIPWPKSMQWGWSEIKFVRPVQWLVALYGGEVVPFEWAGHTAGRGSRGHRFLAPQFHDIASAETYVDTLRTAYVIVDPEARRTTVRAELDRLGRESELDIRPDEGLIDEVINLGEYPVGVAGGFDPSYLEVPEEMIVTAMRTHQRYFAMQDRTGKLANRFATMTATIVKDPVVVSQGNEKVLASRLSDAKFFFGEDRKHSFDDWNKTLDGVVFQAKLGDKARTIGNKIERLVAIAGKLSPLGDDTAAKIAAVCKADLASKAVGEFPELQGVMGKHYARHHQLGDAIADGIEQHWWPKGQGAELPKTDAAAIVALADRMDTIVGCFAVGLEPSGSADPFGLRRAAIGIWQILLDRGWGDRFAPLVAATRTALEAHGVVLKDPAKLDEFFRTRLRGILVDDGLGANEVDAALAVEFRDPGNARERAMALAIVSAEARAVFKRIANILDDARAKHYEIRDSVDAKLFTSPVETQLYDAFTAEQKTIAASHRDQLQILVRLQPHVAAFFDKGGVMVMDPNEQLRTNRLALLNAIYSPFSLIGDFRRLAGAA